MTNEDSNLSFQPDTLNNHKLRIAAMASSLCHILKNLHTGTAGDPWAKPNLHQKHRTGYSRGRKKDFCIWNWGLAYLTNLKACLSKLVLLAIWAYFSTFYCLGSIFWKANSASNWTYNLLTCCFSNFFLTILP